MTFDAPATLTALVHTNPVSVLCLHFELRTLHRILLKVFECFSDLSLSGYLSQGLLSFKYNLIFLHTFFFFTTTHMLTEPAVQSCGKQHSNLLWEQGVPASHDLWNFIKANVCIVFCLFNHKLSWNSPRTEINRAMMLKEAVAFSCHQRPQVSHFYWATVASAQAVSLPEVTVRKNKTFV